MNQSILGRNPARRVIKIQERAGNKELSGTSPLGRVAEVRRDRELRCADNVCPAYTPKLRSTSCFSVPFFAAAAESA